MMTILLTMFLLLAAIILLGIKVLFIKGARFPDGHAHNLPGLQNHRKRKNN